MIGCTQGYYRRVNSFGHIKIVFTARLMRHFIHTYPGRRAVTCLYSSVLVYSGESVGHFSGHIISRCFFLISFSLLFKFSTLPSQFSSLYRISFQLSFPFKYFVFLHEFYKELYLRCHR